MKINSRKTTKGIIVYDCNYLGNNKHCYVAENGGFTAHGVTIKKAISDVQFKIVSEKLKHDPINPETMINLNYYHVATGSCDLGIRGWAKQNGLDEDGEIRADELLPILERTNAHGLDKFKKLINF